MVRLYSKILEYQMRLMRQCSHIWALRYGRDVFKVDEWKAMLSQINELDSMCSRLAGELGQEELEGGMKENNVKIETLVKSWNVGLEALQEQVTNTHMAVGAHATGDRSWREKEEVRKLLQALRAKNPYREQMERTPTRQPGTCNWLLNNPNFQMWRKDPHSRLLWVSANPGSGKSVLSKCLVEEKFATLDPQHATICYFFFKDVSPDSRSITKALSAILHQLFTQIPGLVEHAVSAFDENRDELSSMFSTMWEVLENAAADSRAGEIVCVLDALDECEEAQQITLIEQLKTFYSKAEDSGVPKQKLRFLVTSRPYRNIRTRFHSLTRRFPTVHLSGDDESNLIMEEIDLVIVSEVSAIASERCFDAETEIFLLQQLMKIENRTYLWLHLILDQIRNSNNASNEKAIRKEIQTIPQSVSKAYEAILGKTKDKGLASKMLHIIVGAKTALTLQELNVAMSVEEDSRWYKDLELENATAFELRIKSICGLFIYTDQSKVFLIHQTAKEFLQWNQEVSEPPTGMWKHSLKPEESNSLLAGICVRFLMFDDFETDPALPRDNQYCGKRVFLVYAAMFWAEHLKSSPIEQQNALFEKTVDLCNVGSWRGWTWISVKKITSSEMFSEGSTDLGLASELGLIALVKHFILKGSDVNAIDVEGATALNRAVRHRNKDMVRILLENGADVEAGDWHSPWCDVIDENGLQREEKTSLGRPLMLATTYEDHDMMRTLLAAGADPDARGVENGLPRENALHAATNWGNEQAIHILLDHGANVNARTGEPRCPPRKANWKNFGIEELDRKVRSLRKDIFQNGSFNIVAKMTALHIAVWRDDVARVRLLLDYGADLEAEVFFHDEDHEIESSSLHCDDFGKSTSGPVSLSDEQDTCESSAPGEDLEHISRTSRTQADFSRKNDCLESKLALGDETEILDQVKSGHDADEGASAWNVLDGANRVGPSFHDILEDDHIFESWNRAAKAVSKMTVFHVAASRGAGDVVRLLLLHGVSKRLELAAPLEPTALHLAALLDHDHVVRMILDQTINVDPKDHYGATPLHYAASRGYLNVVNELLEHGANINNRDNSVKTPLHLAASAGFFLVVEDLLDYGADLHAKDGEGHSPLVVAVLHGHKQVVKDLLCYGANLDTEHDHGTTLLHMAALRGHDLVVMELLSHDVDLNAKDSFGVTPLHVAARNGHTSVVEALLAHGADVNAKGPLEDTPLHLAAVEGWGQVVEALLVPGVDVNAKDRTGVTPLHLASHTGHKHSVKWLLDHEGVDTNVKTENGLTPLFFAAHEGHDHVVKELLFHGADLNARDKDGKTLLHVAADKGHDLVVKELLNFVADVIDGQRWHNATAPSSGDRSRLDCQTAPRS